MANRSYVADITTATTPIIIQATGRQTLKTAVVSYQNVAVGEIELSTVSASQIGTAQPTSDVIARWKVGVAGQTTVQTDIVLPVQPFQNIYVHMTGAANVGVITLS